MKKTQQRVIIYHFSLKGWDACKIQKELAETLGTDAYSQVQVSHWLTRFNTKDFSCLDELRTGKPLSNLGPLFEHILEMFPFASVCIIAIHFNV
jgi:hypothetical protein